MSSLKFRTAVANSGAMEADTISKTDRIQESTRVVLNHYKKF